MPPRLAPDVVFRSYVGERGWGQVLLRRAQGARLWLSPVERAIAEACDGGRGPEGIATEATERSGVRVRSREVVEVLARLREAEALVDDEGELEAAPAGPAGLEPCHLDDAQAAALTVSVLPSSSFSCDGRGGCCRLYDLVMLRPRDVAALEQAYGVEGYLPGGLTLGSALGRARLDDGDGEDLMSMAMVEGACAVLEPDGACGVHRRLGPAHKPAGCASYPLVDVLCGDELAVGVACECRCAIDSADDPARGDLLPQAQAIAAQRARLRRVERVADRVLLGPGAAVERAGYVAWRLGARERLAATGDTLAWLLDEAARLSPAPEPVDPGRPSIDGRGFAVQARPVIAQVADYLAREARDTESVYPTMDLQRQLYAWAAGAAESLVTEIDAGRVPDEPARGERLVVAQALHTHDLLRGPDVRARLLSLAVRLLLARADGGPCPEALLPTSVVTYLQRSSRLGQLLDDAAPRLARALGAEPVT